MRIYPRNIPAKNFILILFEMAQLFEEVAPTRTRTTTTKDE